MRRGSVIGPLILIGLGILFLFRNLWPEIPLVDFISRFWPFLLIAWGAIRLIEILFWTLTEKPLPRNGISGGEWALIFVICVVGATMYTAHNASWFPSRLGRRVVLNMGEPYDYSFAAVEKPCAKNCRIVIESFRGNAKIAGSADATTVKASGQETVRSFQQADAETANKQTPLELIQQGDQIIVRTNQDKASDRAQPNADLDITVPEGSSIEAHGRYGDFDIQGVNGNININSDNAGVRLENLGGNVQIETRASDVIRAVNVKGSVELKGRGEDLELQNIGGPVTVTASYVGEIQLSNLQQPTRWDDAQHSGSFEKVPGQIRVSHGDWSGNNIVGPIRMRTHSGDFQISDFTQSLDLTLDRGDIDLKPGKNIPKMEVHTRSGDIDLALPPAAKFDLRMTTDRGDANNEYGDPLHEQASGRGATISGGPGGSDVRLTTGRGSITVRKSSSDDTTTFPEPPNASLKEPASPGLAKEPARLGPPKEPAPPGTPVPPAVPKSPSPPSSPLTVHHE